MMAITRNLNPKVTGMTN